MRLFMLITGIYLTFIAAALAQPLDIKGRWIGKTMGCGDLNLKITSLSENGVIEGTIECTKTRQSAPFGDKLIAGKQMAGKFDGVRLAIEGAQSYTRVKLEGGKLVGYTSGGSGLPRTEVTFVKQ